MSIKGILCLAWIFKKYVLRAVIADFEIHALLVCIGRQAKVFIESTPFMLHLPVRQCASGCCLFPRGYAYLMQRDGPVLNMVLRIFLRAIAQSLQAHSPGAAQVDKAALHIGVCCSDNRDHF